MIQFFQECVNYVNLPVTILMIMVLLYWIMVMVGVFGLDMFDFGLDADADIDIDVAADLDADLGMDVDADGGIETAPAGSFAGSTTTGNEGFLRALFEYFYLGEVPIVIIGTFFILYFWVATFVTNHYFNQDQQLTTSLLFLIPNALISATLMRYTMVPFSVIFRKPPPENKTRDELCGLIGRVTSSEVTEKFGQIEVKRDGDSELVLNARIASGTNPLAKGDAAKIISFNHDDGTFLVQLTKWEKKLDG